MTLLSIAAEKFIASRIGDFDIKNPIDARFLKAAFDHNAAELQWCADYLHNQHILVPTDLYEALINLSARLYYRDNIAIITTVCQNVPQPPVLETSRKRKDREDE